MARKAIATNEGCIKGYWKVVLDDGTRIEGPTRSKKLCVEVAADINQRGSYWDEFAKQRVAL